MIKINILLIGSTGQVGWELHRSLMPLGRVIPVSQSTTPIDLNLAKPDQIRGVIRDLKPQLIVNAAAYTAVDRAESEPELAAFINGVAPGILAEEAKAIGAGLIHYSTDYIFNGQKQSPYQESDQPDPLNIYGKTKLAGEKAIVTVNGKYLILRTSWVYGTRGQNFLRTVLRLAQNQPILRIVNDQWGSPTWCRTIADSTAFILNQSKELSEWFEQFSGIYHLTAAGQTNWYGFARSILELSSPPEPNINLVSIPTLEYPTPAQRPPYSVLDTSLVQNTFGLHLPDWQEVLKLVLKN